MTRYSTKRLNKNSVEGGAYITIGDPYKDTKDVVPARWKGTGFHVPRQPQNADNGNFSKLEHPKGESYLEMEKFTKTQPIDKRKLGFGSKDAFKRGEFTATIRTEQYRDLLRKEQRILDKQRDLEKDAEIIAKSQAKHAASRRFTEGKTETRHLYDIGRTQVTEFDPKHRRDTFYTYDISREKRMGDYTTASREIGDGSWQHHYTSPEHGPIAMTKFFFDKSHLQVV
ncbi:unnamed protein product [Chrysoparadoxa australica]